MSEERVWWLSYADDDGFRGVCILEAPSFLAAAALARKLGISPGGQVVGVEVPEGEAVRYRPYRGKLLSAEETDELR